MIKKLSLAAALLAVSAVALAQPQAAPAQAKPQAPAAAPALTPEQQAQIQQQNAQFVQAATQIAQLVDQGKAGDVWDNASTVAKQVVKRDAFAQSVNADRKAVGAVVSRNVASITRSESNGSPAPAGFYVNVAFATQFANEKQPVRELVSFHLDNDKLWRVSGYTLR